MQFSKVSVLSFAAVVMGAAAPMPEAFALAMANPQLPGSTYECHSYCGNAIIQARECGDDNNCLCASGSEFDKLVPPCLECGSTLWDAYGKFLEPFLSRCGFPTTPNAPANQAPATSSEAPAPAPTSEAPAPAPTSEEAPAPAPSSEAPAPAPSSEAPASSSEAPAQTSEAAPAPSSKASKPSHGGPVGNVTVTVCDSPSCTGKPSLEQVNGASYAQMGAGALAIAAVAALF